MTRVSLFGGVLGVLVAIGTGARPTLARQPDKQPETLIRLSVSPAPAPKPALRYQLLPEMKEMNPGNPIEGYLKCYLEQYRFAFDEAGFAERTALLSMPLEELPGSDSRELRPVRSPRPTARLGSTTRTGRSCRNSRRMESARRWRTCRRCESWPGHCNLRFRSEASRGQVGDAIRTAKTMFAMARHWGEHPTLIGTLVGIGCANMAISPLEELLDQPDCPNFYWALTDLPDPFISLRTGMDGERMTMWSLFRDLSLVTPMSADQLKSFIATMDRMLAGSPQKPAGGLVAYLAARRKTNRSCGRLACGLLNRG